MASDHDPMTQSTLRKLRAFMGFLANTEELLHAKEFDLAEAYRFALREYDRLEQLEVDMIQDDPTQRLLWERETIRVEAELLERLSRGVEFVRHHCPRHPMLPHYLSYHARWRQSLHPAPSVPVPSVALGPSPRRSVDTEVFGFSLDRLVHLHAQLTLVEMPHEFAESFLLFLAGLRYATIYQSRHRGLPQHPEQDGLHSLSRQCLDRALDFALQSEPQNLARTFVRLPADTAFHCLFMGIAFLRENMPAPAMDWIERTRPQENRLRLFFAVGVHAAFAPNARRLLRQVQSDLLRLTSEHMGPEFGQILQDLGMPEKPGPA